jgi:peptidoglycan biosynthesis protein MviN/MurJ (putative lipid II flippase)
LNDTRTPVRISVITVAAKIALNLIFAIRLGFLGLALATTIASWLNFGLLLKRLQPAPRGRSYRQALGPYIRIALASFTMGLLALSAFKGCGMLFPGTGVFALAVELGLAILVSLISLFPLLRIFKVEEGNELLHMVGSLNGKSR